MDYVRTPFKRRWIWKTVLVLVLSLVLVGLGLRELNRHAERMAYIEGVIAEVSDAPFQLTGTEQDEAYAERVYHLVEADGYFDFDHQVILKNRFYEDVMGYHLITPFIIDGGSRAVLVDRGWIPPEGIESVEDTRRYDTPEMKHILARIAPQEEPTGQLPSPDDPQLIWYRVDVQGIGAQLPYPVLSYYVALEAPETRPEQPPYPDPPRFKLDAGPHYGNAIKWFLFAALLPLFYAWLTVRAERSEA